MCQSFITSVVVLTVVDDPWGCGVVNLTVSLLLLLVAVEMEVVGRPNIIMDLSLPRIGL